MMYNIRSSQLLGNRCLWSCSYRRRSRKVNRPAFPRRLPTSHNCLTTFIERLLVGKERSFILQSRWAAIAAMQSLNHFWPMTAQGRKQPIKLPAGSGTTSRSGHSARCLAGKLVAISNPSPLAVTTLHGFKSFFASSPIHMGASSSHF